jgi:glycosyltransferase involved in cell wall biosynthesis
VFGNHGGFFRERRAREEGVLYIHTPTGLNRGLNRVYGAAKRISTQAAGDRRDLPRFAAAWRDLGYAVAAQRRSRELGCDIMHVMNYSQFIPIIRWLNPGIKISLHMHCEWLTQLDRDAIERRISCADLIVGCSEYITKKIIDRFPQFESRCVTVPNSAQVVEESDRGVTDPGYVLFVGRVSPEKGVHDLVKAFREVLRSFPNARLHIVGDTGSVPYEYLIGLSDDPHVTDLRIFYGKELDGRKDPYLGFLEREAGEELGKRIIFEGGMPHSTLDGFYGRAALLVNPSLSESFGITPIEAMMCGVPVVATRVGGMTYTVDHGVTGLLVEPADSRALASAICEVLGDPERGRRMGEAGRERAIAKFSWEKTTEILLDHFHRIVREEGRTKTHG